MKVIAGPLNGHQLKMHQYANDWVTVDVVTCPYDNDGNGNCERCANAETMIINPTNVQLDSAAEAEDWKTHQHTGSFWNEYELGEDRRFRRKVRYDPKEHRT